MKQEKKGLVAISELNKCYFHFPKIETGAFKSIPSIFLNQIKNATALNKIFLDVPGYKLRFLLQIGTLIVFDSTCMLFLKPVPFFQGPLLILMQLKFLLQSCGAVLIPDFIGILHQDVTMKLNISSVYRYAFSPKEDGKHVSFNVDIHFLTFSRKDINHDSS